LPIKPSTYDAITEAAFLTFSKTPGASLDDVAQVAGVGRATLYRHFKNRRVLMVALARIAVAELDAAVDAATLTAKTHGEGLKLALSAIVPLADRQWFLANEPLHDDQKLAETYQSGAQELHREIDRARAEGVFASDVPTFWIAETFDNLVYAAWSCVKEGRATPAQAADLAWRTLISGTGGE